MMALDAVKTLTGKIQDPSGEQKVTQVVLKMANSMLARQDMNAKDTFDFISTAVSQVCKVNKPPKQKQQACYLVSQFIS